nr:uncharacterized protein c1d4.02c [Quercus suber]
MANLFGTLNRFISRLDADPNQSSTQSRPNSSTTAGYGFQILRNLSPSIPLEPWFDFIIGINGRTLDSSDPTLFSTEVRNCAGATVSLGVFSAKGQVIRETYISVPSAHESLGLSLQWAPLRSIEDVWHILDVMPNSPADVAGLLPYSDYVIGTPEADADAAPPLRGEASLGALVERFMARPLRLFVYNHEYDVTRLVTITPAKGWGGEGALGCVLGFGALHRVPAPLLEPSQAPGETLFDSGSADAASTLQAAPPPPPQAAAAVAARAGGSEFLVPADMPNLAQPSPPPPPSSSPGPTPQGRPGRKARAPHAAPGAGLDDYFAEGEQKSREVDNAPKAKAGGGGLPPPPPKAGAGPPRAAAAASKTVDGDGEGEGEGEGEAEGEA